MHEAGEASFPASPGNGGAPTSRPPAPRIISQPGCRGSGRRVIAASAASGSRTAVWGGWKVWGDAFNEFRIKTMQQRISQRYLEQTLLLDDVSISPLPLKKRLECRDVSGRGPGYGQWHLRVGRGHRGLAGGAGGPAAIRGSHGPCTPPPSQPATEPAPLRTPPHPDGAAGSSPR